MRSKYNSSHDENGRQSNVRWYLPQSFFPEKGLTLAFFRWLLQHISRDLKTAEDIVRSAQFDWTIVRPPRLTNGPYSSYRIASEALPTKGNVASFRAVATFMLDGVERERSHLRELVGLAK